MVRHWKVIAATKQEQRSQLIPPDWILHSKPTNSELNVLEIPAKCGILTARELKITSDYDAYALTKELKQGTFTAAETAVAFCKRAAIAQQLVNCLTEILFEQAIERARLLDKERESGKPLRPLHGLPISLKDSFRVPGVDSTIGLACFAEQPDDHYSPLAQQLIDLGAVLYCKTNVPQTLMTADSDNNVFGRTLNPNNLTLTAGGSTGGEGALIALRGSILGVGTDVAGSVRIPAVCNGICSFKPSAWIVPYTDQREPVEDGYVGGVDSVAGPMATTIRDCEYFMKTIMDAQPSLYDPCCHRLHWQHLTIVPTQLRIGYIFDNSMYTPHPPVLRTMKQSVDSLANAGITMIPIRLPSVFEAFMTTIELYGIDENKYIQALIRSTGEPFVPSVVKKDLPNTAPMDMGKLFKLNADRCRWQVMYNQLWKEHGIDAIMTPPAPHTAVPLDEWLSISYTCIWNLMDYPACIIPTGHVLNTDVRADSAMAKYGELDQQAYDLYSGPDDFRCAPTAIQLVGQRQEDEKLLQIAKVVESALR